MKKETEPKKIGRPPEPVPKDKADEIIDWISSGKTLRDYCRSEGAPHHNTVYDWLEKDKEFAGRFARARETGHEVIAQECLEIADDATNDWMEKHDKDGNAIGWQVNGDHVRRSALRIDTRLKLLAKWNPKKWGDKIVNEHTGSEGGPIQISDNERAAKVKALIAAASQRKTK